MYLIQIHCSYIFFKVYKYLCDYKLKRIVNWNGIILKILFVETLA